MNAVAEKRRTLDIFKQRLLQSEVGDRIARLILYGSLARGDVTLESDIDVAVISFHPLQKVDRLCGDLSFEVMLETGHLVEPMVYCVDDYRFPHYFLKRVKEEGKELYRMTKKEEKKAEAGDLLDFARTYLRIAAMLQDPASVRGAIDLGYNAIELCLKALLVLKMDRLPKTHTGLNQKFGETYVKAGMVPAEQGRSVRRALEKRNKARYDPHAVLTINDAQEILQLGQRMMDLTEEMLKAASGKSKR